MKEPLAPVERQVTALDTEGREWAMILVIFVDGREELDIYCDHPAAEHEFEAFLQQAIKRYELEPTSVIFHIEEQQS